MKENTVVINVMADGTICNDLSTYLDENHQLPDTAKRIILEFIREGHNKRMKNGG